MLKGCKANSFHFSITTIIVFFIIIAFPALFGCGSASNPPVEETRFMMDTLVRIAVYDQMSRKRALTAIERAFEVIESIEQKTSSYIDTSDISLLNKLAGIQPIKVSDETARILTQAVVLSEKTSGAFDVTIGAVKDLWNFQEAQPRKPSDQEIDDALSRVDYREIDNQTTTFLNKKGMKIDLGGIAKGYAIDKGAEALINLDIKAAIVEAGGDLRIIGLPPSRNRWRIGVRHPEQEMNQLFGILELNEICVATSGDYERFFEHDGVRYHHILDPRTGYPARGCSSVTILAPSALEADAYATAVFVLGRDAGLKLVQNTPGIECLILYREQGKLKSIGTEPFLSRFQRQVSGG